MKIREILYKRLNENEINTSFEEVLEKNKNSLNIPLINYMMNDKFLFMNSSITYGIVTPPIRRYGVFERVLDDIFDDNSINASPTKSFEMRGITNPDYITGGNPCYVFPLNNFSFFVNKNNKELSYRKFVNKISGEYYKNIEHVPDEFIKVVSDNRYKQEFLNGPEIYFFRVDVLKLNMNDQEDFDQKVQMILTLLNKRDEFVNKKINKKILNDLLREFLKEVVLKSDQDIKHILETRAISNSDKIFNTLRNLRNEFIKQNSSRILDILNYNSSTELLVSDDMKEYLEEKLLSGAVYKNNVKGIDPDFSDYLDNYIINPVLINGPCLIISYYADKRMKLIDKLKNFIQ